jgi:peptidoglycan/LPS O-acetylase OafA/YrhL
MIYFDSYFFFLAPNFNFWDQNFSDMVQNQRKRDLGQMWHLNIEFHTQNKLLHLVERQFECIAK